MSIAEEEISFTTLLKTQKQFEEYRGELNSDKDITATIKAFEYCQVDIIDWNRISEEFRGLIKKDLVKIEL